MQQVFKALLNPAVQGHCLFDKSCFYLGLSDEYFMQ